MMMMMMMMVTSDHVTCRDNNNNNNVKPIKFAQAANSRYVSVSNRSAFSLFLKVLRDPEYLQEEDMIVSVDRKSYGRLFQTTGPLTEKLRSP